MRRSLASGPDDEQLKPVQRFRDLAEPVSWYRDLEVVVLAIAAAEEEVDRPARCDVPGRTDAGEPVGDLAGPPGLPFAEIWLEGLHRSVLVLHATYS